nr:imelysin family protein [uncultured Bacteroides sp.]
MKNWKVLPLMVMGACITIASCEDSKREDVKVDPFTGFSTPDSRTATDAELKSAVATYVDNVVIPTYQDMYNKMSALNNAVKSLSTSSTDNNVADAANAWVAARKPWEQSEAFLYGPADLNKLDPSLDSWPLDKDGIDQILLSGNWSDAVGGDVDDREEAPADAPQNLRGFHTAEYLLFADGESKKISDLDANKIGYLKAVINRMLQDTELLLKGWTDGTGLENGAYKEAMKNPNGNYGFSNIKQSVAMMLNSDNGAEGIANEVGATKIGDPVDKWNSGDKDAGVLAVESWYSWNSLDDYTDNIRSIRNAYYGTLDGTVATNSLCSIMKEVNPTLNTMLVNQIQETITAINDIPHPFRNNLGATTEVKNAQSQCAYLCTGLALVRAKLAGE